MILLKWCVMKSVIYKVHGRNVEIPREYEHLVQMKRRDDIAEEYNIPKRILLRRLKESKIILSHNHILPIEDIIEIYLILGWPLVHRKEYNNSNSLSNQNYINK